MALNVDSPVPAQEEAERHPYTDEERRYVMVLTITGDYASRMRSYELLAQAFQ